jgi:hypothetical protein
VGPGTATVLLVTKADFTALKRNFKPVPDKLTFCGLSELLSVMERVALNVPKVFGAKVTVMMQDTPAATLEPQVFFWEKEVLATAMLLMLSAVLPVLVSVTVRDALKFVLMVPKARLSGTSFTVPLVSVTMALPDFVESVTEVAVTATVAGLGTAAGAVYVVAVPLGVLVGANVPHADTHRVGGVPCIVVQLTPAMAGSF